VQEQEKVISDEQIRQLLIFMGTITVISFVLVIALITVFIAFIWYSRTRLQGCSCHNRGKEKELGGGGGELGGAVGQQGHHRHHGLSSGHHTVKMFAVDPGQFQLRSHKNVIVNPLPGSSGPGGVADLGGNDLVGVAVNQSVAGPQARVQSEDGLGQIESVGSQQAAEEPIYAEIKPCKVEKTLNKVEQQESEAVPGRKKEIEYWQITAKEVVKFRPCTETFIQRE